jgi:hypothetical protein
MSQRASFDPSDASRVIRLDFCADECPPDVFRLFTDFILGRRVDLEPEQFIPLARLAQIYDVPYLLVALARHLRTIDDVQTFPWKDEDDTELLVELVMWARKERPELFPKPEILEITKYLVGKCRYAAVALLKLHIWTDEDRPRIEQVIGHSELGLRLVPNIWV